MWLFPGEKKWDPTNHFNHGWYEFQLKYWNLCFDFCKTEVLDPTSRDIWSRQHYMLYHDEIIKKSDKKSSLIQFHISYYSQDYGCILKCLKEAYVSEKERKKLLQKYELSKKG